MEAIDLPSPQLDLYTPPDVAEAVDEWGANCGPAALAAALRVPLGRVRVAVSPSPPSPAQRDLLGTTDVIPAKFRGYMGIGQMKLALQAMRSDVGRVWSAPHIEALRRSETPEGRMVLVCIQWVGPWMGTRGQSTYRHWVVYTKGFLGLHGPEWIYDVNSDWCSYDRWAQLVCPGLMPKRGTGWKIQWAGVAMPMREAIP